MAEELAKRLAARGHRVEVITNHPGGAFEPVERRDGVTLHRAGSIPSPRWFPAIHRRNREALALARSIISTDTGDWVVGTHHAYFERAVRGLGLPWISVFEGPWGGEYRWSQTAKPRSWARKFLDPFVEREFVRRERRLLKNARRIVVISRHFEKKIREWHPISLPPITRLHGSVDMERFAMPQDREAIRFRYRLDSGDRVFLAVRRLDPRMGLDTLLRAFASLAPAWPKARLWMAGTGPMEETLRREIESLALGDRIQLLGRVSEEALPSLYAAADLVVMPSLDLEGFGLATIEAMACGTPVIGSRAAATPEILEPLSPELLFEPGSVHDLAMKMTACLSDPNRLPPGQACRDYVKQHYGWERWVAAWEAWAKDKAP